MMAILPTFFLAIFTALSVFAMEQGSTSSQTDKATIHVHNVGQGNFATIEIPHKTENKKG
ncbi:hypothetical protein [Candidatus Paracaedibacter symbiosus]|uniref:hypothetical protein n=1 Tax=Candidatus Paracaedibacter symbiosus TaxID=244582 RepID=UPI000509C361|nr:hypothetical protein [Candidatus Paracaedibacter symbiosus]